MVSDASSEHDPLYLADDAVIHVFSKLMWTKFKEMYMIKLLINTLCLKTILSAVDGLGVKHAKYLSNYQRILIDLLSVGENVEKKIKTLILL